MNAVILDTDHLSLVLRQAECPLLDRLDQVPPDDVATTIVSFQEQVQGWLAYLQGARGDRQILRAYAELDALLRWFAKMNVLAFDQEAQNRFQSLRKQCRRVGTLDLRIACIALATDSTLLSRNLRDYRQVPGLRVEDWT